MSDAFLLQLLPVRSSILRTNMKSRYDCTNSRVWLLVDHEELRLMVWLDGGDNFISLQISLDLDTRVKSIEKRYNKDISIDIEGI